MVIYFSGTGNSRWCAEVLAELLQDSLLDAADYIKNGIAADLRSQKPWVFVAPTYAWQLPRVFESFIRSGSFQGNCDAYFILTCGSDIGNAGQPLSALCRDIGLHYQGILEVRMPENYIAMFNVPPVDRCLELIRAARPVLERGAACICSASPFPAVKITLADKLKSGFINRGFYTYYVNAKSFYATEDCISCGKCEDLCPLNNIRLADGKPTWGDHCTHCMACICYCPSKAIEYGKRSQGKPRYRCEDYLKQV